MYFSIGLGFAIPVDQAKRIADELVSTGTVQHASLGVRLTADDTHGAAVAGVVDGGPAAAAGLFSSTLPMIGLSVSMPLPRKTMVNSRMGSRKFISEPAAMTSIRAQIGLVR